MRKFIVGAYWGGLLTVAFGLLPIIVFRPRMLPIEAMEHLQHLTPFVVLAGFALLTSVLAAGTILILREIAAMRAAMESPSQTTSNIAARAARRRAPTVKATQTCPGCGGTNWAEAFACVECGAPLSCDGAAAAA